MQIFTIGYEGASIHDFIDTLDLLKVEHVIDIRDVPASRKRDFSKNILRRHLEDSGIRYSHFKALGDPKDGREAMRSGNKAKFLEIFSARIATQEAQDALEAVSQIALDETSVLLCYERDYKDCHRAIVATELERRDGFSVQHRGVRKDAGKQHLTGDERAVV